MADIPISDFGILDFKIYRKAKCIWNLKISKP